MENESSIARKPSVVYCAVVMHVGEICNFRVTSICSIHLYKVFLWLLYTVACMLLWVTILHRQTVCVLELCCSAGGGGGGGAGEH